MTDNSPGPTQRLLSITLMAALIAMGATLQIPLGPVPLSLQTFFVLLAGFVLGPVRGVLAVMLYLAAGLLGLPVFAGGTSGIAKLLGPTGGFLIGFVPMAAIVGVAMRGRRPLRWLRGLAWGALASLAPLALGVPWLEQALDLGWRKALDVGLFPFLPGAVIKLVICVATVRFLEKRRLFSE